jgi:divalent metal cation (Fe/Co/Zn/Cd) transporter
MDRPAWRPTADHPYGHVRPKRHRMRGCFGIGCAAVLIVLAIAVVLAVVGGTRTTVKTNGEGMAVVAALA